MSTHFISIFLLFASSQDVTYTLGKAKSVKPPSVDQEATGSALAPNTHLGSAPGEVAPVGQKLLLRDYDSFHPAQKSYLGELSEEQCITAPIEANTAPAIFSQQDLGLAQTKMKDPCSGSEYVPQRLQDITPEDQHITWSIAFYQLKN